MLCSKACDTVCSDWSSWGGSAFERLADAALLLRRLFTCKLPLLRQSAAHALHGLVPARKALLVGRQLGRL